MTTSTGPAGNGRAAALGRALGEVRRSAAAASDELLHHVPDTGDHVTGRAVDDFVEQASDALRALAESVGDALGRLSGVGSTPVVDVETEHHTPQGWGR